MIVPLPDDLIAQIRARSANPDTRTDVSPTARGHTVSMGSLSLRGLDLQALLRGDPDPTPRPADEAPPPPIAAAALQAIETREGFTFPMPLRQLYLDVADGGFGPGSGLMPAAEVAHTWRGLRDTPPGRRGQVWPGHLLPFTRTAPGHDCIDTGDGRIIYWDEEMLADGASDRVWKRSFKPEAPDLATWLHRWLDSKSPEEQMREQMVAAQNSALKASLDYWRARTPEERKAFGLPDEGWEDALFGHLGIDLGKL